MNPMSIVAKIPANKNIFRGSDNLQPHIFTTFSFSNSFQGIDVDDDVDQRIPVTYRGYVPALYGCEGRSFQLKQTVWPAIPY